MENRAINKLYHNKEWLIEKYCTEDLSATSISIICNCSVSSIYQFLIKFSIQRRKPGPLFCSEETKQKTRLRLLQTGSPMRGKKHSAKTKLLMSQKRNGSANGNWKGGITLYTRHFRKSKKYKEWRNACLKRDNYKCKYCNCNATTNIVHHIKPAKDFPALRIVVSNGMTICEKHHKLIHSKKFNYGS